MNICACKVEYDTNKYLNNLNECLDCFLQERPECKDRTKLCKDLRCRECYNRSFLTYSRGALIPHKFLVSDTNPRMIAKRSGVSFDFYCPECKHEFPIRPSQIYNGSWCSYCGGKRLCGKDDCKTCFDKSFASDDQVKYWSKNNKIDPKLVFKRSHTDYLFDCPECKHEFKISPNKIQSRQWCGYCASKLICGECDYCYEKSFASHEKAKYWIKERNDEHPVLVFKNSHTDYWFKCPDCPHEFSAPLDGIVAGKWCPYCGGSKLCEDKDCEFCFNKSFASVDKSAYLIGNQIDPRRLRKGSPAQYSFKCPDCGHEFPYALCTVSNGHWCPMCKKKTEKKVFEFLISNFNISFQFKADWCKNERTNRYYPFDYCIDEYKIIIELDGIQHFEDINYWRSKRDEILKRDVFKMEQAIDNGYAIIRLVQEEVWKDKYGWQEELLRTIRECVSERGLYFISCNKELYNAHKELMNRIYIFDL